MQNSELLGRFKRLFRGHDKYHGRYPVNGETRRDPTTGLDGEWQPWTELHRPLSDELWKQHLLGGRGNFGLGIIPVTQDGLCSWGAIDYDTKAGGVVQEADLQDLAARVKREGLPLVLCRSKSGGAHFYLFLAEWCPAEIVIRRLRGWAELLKVDKCPLPDRTGHYRRSEIFPQQKHLNPNARGSWINLPYYGAKGSERSAYRLNSDGVLERLNLPQFLDLAESSMLSRAQLEAFESKMESTLHPQSPPCLIELDKRGYIEGTRDNGLFNVAILFAKLDRDGWQMRVREYNVLKMDPPMSDVDVTKTIMSVARNLEKDPLDRFKYKCKDQPIADFCEKKKCRTMEFGIGSFRGVGQMAAIERLVKIATDPPRYIATVSGRELHLSTQELMEPRMFKRRAFEQLDLMVVIPKLDTWEASLEELLENMEVIDAPEDASEFGRFRQHFGEFLKKRQTESWEEVLRGYPYEAADETGATVIHFKSEHLLKYLEDKCKFREYSPADLYNAIKKLGGWHMAKQRRINGKVTNLWVVPVSVADGEQTEPFTVPTISDPEY